MRIEAIISLPKQLTVEPFFTPARLVPSEEQDRRPSCIKGESHPPCTICCAEAKFLHVRVPGALQRIDARPPQ